jgi:hypothetical protein
MFSSRDGQEAAMPSEGEPTFDGKRLEAMVFDSILLSTNFSGLLGGWNQNGYSKRTPRLQE